MSLYAHMAGLATRPAPEPLAPDEPLLIDAAVLVNVVYFSERSRSRREDGIAAAEDPQPVVTAPRLADFVRSLLDRFAPTLALAAWDGRGSARKAADPSYKASRAPKPYGLRALLEVAPEVFQSCGVGSARADGWEADDVIASAAMASRAAVIVSNDKDFAQLLQYPGNRWWNPVPKGHEETGGCWVTAYGVELKWGVTPAQFRHWQAIAGDTADNVPGCPGIGAVGAAVIIRRYHTITATLAALDARDEWLDQFAHRLRAGRESVLRALNHVTLNTGLAVKAAPTTTTQEIDPMAFANPFLRKDAPPVTATLMAESRGAPVADEPAAETAPEAPPTTATETAADARKPGWEDKVCANALAAVSEAVRNAVACRQADVVVTERATLAAANYPAGLAPTPEQIQTLIAEATARRDATDAQRAAGDARTDDNGTDHRPARSAAPRPRDESIPNHTAIPREWREHKRSQLQLALAMRCRNDLARVAHERGFTHIPVGAPSLLRARLLDEIACLCGVLTGVNAWSPVEWPAWTGGSGPTDATARDDEAGVAEASQPEQQPEAQPQSDLAGLARADAGDAPGIDAVVVYKPSAVGASDAGADATAAAHATAERDDARAQLAKGAGGRLLLIDCQPLDGSGVELDAWVQPFAAEVCLAKKVDHVLLVPYAQVAVATLVARHIRDGHDLPTTLVVRRSSPLADACLPELRRAYGVACTIEATR